jgi:hypothetical protein
MKKAAARKTGKEEVTSMKLYFSGISGPSEYCMLESAGVKRMLVDPFDLKHIPSGRAHVALDSGAYRVLKRNLKRKRKLNLDLESYLTVVRSRGPFDFAVSLDVIGDAAKTRENWKRLRSLKSVDDPPFIPVFQWGSPNDELKRYLDEAPVVGIGGLVGLMRDKNERMLTQLRDLCAAHPQRFHVFGISWLRAINQLHTMIASGDTSKFLAGRRRMFLIFIHDHTRKLSEAPIEKLKLELDREELCIQSARNLEAFISGKMPSKA